jgi:hypothetical protein
MKIITRKEAASTGLKLYFTGKPCKRGHIVQRRTSPGTCVECEKILQKTKRYKRYQKEIKKTEKYKEMAKTYRESIYHTDKYKAQVKNTHLKRTYGITLEEFNILLHNQNNSCKICNTIFNDETTPCVDHCHDTENIRGIVCHPCNKLLGFAKDDIRILKNAIKYLEINPSNKQQL